jgi:diaminopimelate decarboxylase
MIRKKPKFLVGGVDAFDLVEEYATPLYVYDAGKILRQCKKLQYAFRGFPSRILYAMKANSNSAILRLLHKQGAFLDVISLEEARIGLGAGYKPSEILYTPNSVGFVEYEQALELGITINIDNISMLEQFGHEHGSVPCSIRINPHVLAGGHSHIQTGHIDSKFGISIHQLRHVHRIVEAYKMRIVGLHMHTGSEIVDEPTFVASAEILFETAKQFNFLHFLDFGSGFKVKYRPGDIETDVVSFGNALARQYKSFTRDYGKKAELWFEPGKYLVSEAGYFLVSVNVVKQTPSTVFVGVNSGFNHLIRPMFYDAYHEIVNISNPKGVERVYSVVGYICETDTFAADRKLPEVRVGDILCFKNAGAYGYSMSSQYNAHPRPAEVLIYKGKPRLIRARETLEDIVMNEVKVEL